MRRSNPILSFQTPALSQFNRSPRLALLEYEFLSHQTVRPRYQIAKTLTPLRQAIKFHALTLFYEFAGLLASEGDNYENYVYP